MDHLHAVLFAFCLLLTVLLAMMDPGYLKPYTPGKFYQILMKSRNEHTLCPVCRVQKNERSRHCYYCDRCVDCFDHHCPWINNCIGANNTITFYFFILTQFFYLVCNLYILVAQLRSHSMII